MGILKTAGVREFECGFFAVVENTSLYADIRGVSLGEAAAIFSDKAETVQLWFNEEYHAHFTALAALIPQTDSIKVCLRKE